MSTPGVGGRGTDSGRSNIADHPRFDELVWHVVRASDMAVRPSEIADQLALKFVAGPATPGAVTHALKRLEETHGLVERVSPASPYWKPR